MDGRAFLDLLSRIAGETTAARLAAPFGDLDRPSFPGGIAGFEALAVHAHVAEAACRDWIDAQIRSLRPSRDAQAFADVLDGALSKLPAHRTREGLAFFGASVQHPVATARRYLRDGELVLRGPTFASQKPEAAYGGNLLFLVRSRSARPVWHLSDAAGVDEVLFPCHRRFRVDMAEEGAGKAAIFLSEGGADGPFVMTPREKAALLGFFSADLSSLSTRAGGPMHSPAET